MSSKQNCLFSLDWYDQTLIALVIKFKSKSSLFFSLYLVYLLKAWVTDKKKTKSKKNINYFLHFVDYLERPKGVEPPPPPGGNRTGGAVGELTAALGPSRSSRCWAACCSCKSANCCSHMIGNTRTVNEVPTTQRPVRDHLYKVEVVEVVQLTTELMALRTGFGNISVRPQSLSATLSSSNSSNSY